MTAFWNTAPSGLVELDALMTEAVSTFESSVYFYESTQRCIPESCHLLSRRSETMKYDFFTSLFSLAYIVHSNTPFRV
jgi:hypothetical protein